MLMCPRVVDADPLSLVVDDDVDEPGAKRSAVLVLLLVVLHLLLLVCVVCVMVTS